ncbi:MAG TPA: arsenite methyltransferase [Synergistales bacterium]|jgi:SAM-dependent methyltransferase|nr:arsenite methyltransferase [Synergistales bacterium]HRV71841.1 arsenite methyltransferase [Thermovirgaceae bacterium]
MDDIREKVRKKYAEAIRNKRSCCGGSSSCCGGTEAGDPITAGIYEGAVLERIPGGVEGQSFGCGSPVEMAGLKPGETVLDLGSGAGLDAFLAGGEVGVSGKVFGLDMTDEMILTAESNRIHWGLENVEFLKGFIEEIPLPDESIDVVVSNCVINLSPDKDAVFREIFRVLKPGGRISVSDVVFLRPIPEEIRASIDAWAGCVAGALGREEYEQKLAEAGFTGISVSPTRVYDFTPSQLEEMFPDLSGAKSLDAGGVAAGAWISAMKPRPI